MQSLDTFEHNGLTVTIEIDHDVENPHDECPGAKLVMWGGRNYTFPNDVSIDFGAHEGWSAVADEQAKRWNAIMVTPVWVYDHSGVALKAGARTYPFDDKWDSAQVGFAYITQETYQACTGKRYVGRPAQYAKAQKLIETEVSVYGQWVNGECYGFVITDEHGYTVDSCGGFIGMDSVIEAAKYAADHAV